MRPPLWLLVPLAVACQTHESAGPEPHASTAALAQTAPAPAAPTHPGATPAAPATNDAAAAARVGTNPGHVGAGTPLTPAPGHELAAFAEGCFWGSENTFRHVKGVVATAVGYTGGHTEMPTYEDVSSHATGHAESVLVEFDPKIVSYSELLHVFWETHNPTTKDRQGPDIGSNYRSAIWTFSPEQDRLARESEQQEQTHYDRPITTEIRAIGRFYKAEDYHQQYDQKSGVESCPLPLRGPKT